MAEIEQNTLSKNVEPKAYIAGNVIATPIANAIKAGGAAPSPAPEPAPSSLPDYSEASDGDALVIEDGEPVWAAPTASGNVVRAEMSLSIDGSTQEITPSDCSMTGTEIATAIINGAFVYLFIELYAGDVLTAYAIFPVIAIQGDASEGEYFAVVNTPFYGTIMVYADGHCAIDD